MKLLDGGAVLLIIGAAVIGPIQSKVMPVRENTPYTTCGFLYGQMTVDERLDQCKPLPLKYETIAETCERAMQEIGATKEWPYPNNPRQPKPPTKGAWYLKDTRVFCIPAPSGLR